MLEWEGKRLFTSRNFEFLEFPSSPQVLLKSRMVLVGCSRVGGEGHCIFLRVFPLWDQDRTLLPHLTPGIGSWDSANISSQRKT